jgi:branched-subunit amino acid aminotransferase/4-amino-4-deoxychorismate lyase
MPHDGPFQTQIDGRPATAADLAPLAFAGFAHFTAMQVRDGAVRGLDLHLDRLRAASLAFFGRALPDDLVRARLGAAIRGGPADLSLSATMFSRTGEFTPAGADDDPAILVRTGPAAAGPAGPLRLMTIQQPPRTQKTTRPWHFFAKLEKWVDLPKMNSSVPRGQTRDRPTRQVPVATRP